MSELSRVLERHASFASTLRYFPVSTLKASVTLLSVDPHYQTAMRYHHQWNLYARHFL